MRNTGAPNFGTMWTICILLILGDAFKFVSSLEEKAEFVPTPKQIVAIKGSTAILYCRVQGVSFYKVIWSFQRRILTLDTRRIVADERLTLDHPYQSEWNLHIADVRTDDAGTYSCQINTQPLKSYEVELHVLDQQPIPVLPKEVVTLSGGDIEIPCKLPDVNDIGVWSYKAHEKSEKETIDENDKFRFQPGQGQDSHVHTLVIKNVGAGDDGQYFCRARSGAEAVTSLKVVVSPQPPTLVASAESPNRLQARWQRPESMHGDLVGYTVYVHDHDTGKESVFEVSPSDLENGDESFTIDDLTTQTMYTVQLACKLQLGSKVTLGKRSPEVNITTPLFIPEAPGSVKVKRLSDDEAEVQWSPPSDADTPGIIRGYSVTYALVDAKTMTRSGKELSVRVAKPDGKKWSAILPNLKTKNRYEIHVAGFTRKGIGRYSKPVVYLHKPMPPELSLNGRVLSDSSVLLTVGSMGSGKMSNVKLFYTEQSEAVWKPLDFQPELNITVVGGLDPSTNYFFKVRAKIGGKLKQSVTHVSTPPHDLRAPQGVQVSATASTSIQITWDYIIANQSSSSMPMGYLVHLEESPEEVEKARKQRQSVVFNKTSVEVKNLTQGMRYNIVVEAFNGLGEGPRSEGLLFQIAESDAKPDAVNKPIVPRFTYDLPERLTVQKGELVKIPCVAEGFPMPEVRWYEGEVPIGVVAQGSNQLYMAKVQRSTILTCKAISKLGQIQATTYVTVADDETEDTTDAEEGPVEQQQEITLGISAINIRETSFSLTWKVQAGDASDIDRFQIKIIDSKDKVLLTRSLPAQTSSFNLHSLTPGTGYRAVLSAMPAGRESDAPLAEAMTSLSTLKSGQLIPPVPNSGSIVSPAVTRITNNATRITNTVENARTEAPAVVQDVSYRARIALTIVEVTPTSAQLEWEFTGLDPRYVQLFDLKVKSRTNVTLLSESLKPNLNEMTLTLHSGQTYHVQVRALDRRGEVLALSTTQIITPTSRVGPSSPQESDRTGDTTDKEQPPVLKRASLTLSVHAVSGDSARMDWTLSGVQESDIGQFVMKVKDAEDRTLLRQEMRPESRSLTLSNLTPKTRYFLELSALDDKGATVVTTTSSLTTTTANANEVDDDSRTLRVFTEELTSSSVKIAWYTPPKILPDLSSVSVTLTDIANVTLLTQQMSPLTRSLTVRNLQAGERYSAHVQVMGPRDKVFRTGYLEFDTEPTPGMPGRPKVVEVQSANNTAVRLDWRNTPSPSPAAGSDDVNGYVIHFAQVGADNQPFQGVFQFPVFGAASFVVIPNLKAGSRYMFQVAARNQYSFGPLSTPVYVDLPLQFTPFIV